MKEPRGMTVDEAIDIVARHVLYVVADGVGDRWEDYPELGENDWEQVVTNVLVLAQPPSDEDYAQAYKLLTERAEFIDGSAVPQSGQHE